MENVVATQSSPGWLAVRFRSLRAFSLPASILPPIVATAAVLPFAGWRWDILVCAVIGAAALHVAGNLVNDYYDYLKGVDRKIEGDEGRPGRVLVRGLMTPRQVVVEAAAFILLATVLAVYICWRGGHGNWSAGPGALAFGMAGMALLYAYTGPPLGLKFHALGELVIFITFGPLLVLGAAFVQTGELAWSAAMISLPIGLATTAILTGNNLRDEEEDGDGRIITLTHFAGPAFMRGLYTSCVLGSVAVLTVIGALGLATRAMLAAPLLLLLVLDPLKAVLTGKRLPDIDARTAKFCAALYIFIILCLAIGGPVRPL